MVKDGRAMYVGVANMGLAKRIYFYGKPGKTQLTSLRINELLKKEVTAGASIDIYTTSPPDFQWAGLPVSAIAGLEYGLISSYCLPWNIRGSR
jgi:hypothetical protein